LFSKNAFVDTLTGACAIHNEGSTIHIRERIMWTLDVYRARVLIMPTKYKHSLTAHSSGVDDAARKSANFD
jgi:hypothetical protein